MPPRVSAFSLFKDDAMRADAARVASALVMEWRAMNAEARAPFVARASAANGGLETQPLQLELVRARDANRAKDDVIVRLQRELQRIQDGSCSDDEMGFCENAFMEATLRTTEGSGAFDVHIRVLDIASGTCKLA